MSEQAIGPTPEILISGRAMVARHAADLAGAAARTFEFSHIRQCDGLPAVGDLRLEATVDAASRTAVAASMRGSVIASIFDGLCWQRFDLATLTSNTRFAGPMQLAAVITWVISVVEGSAGRTCERRETKPGVHVFAATQVRSPRTLSSPPATLSPASAHAPSELTLQASLQGAEHDGSAMSGLPALSQSAPRPIFRRLTYVSRRTPGLTDEALLHQLLTPAAERNHREGISGCLWCGERSFVQVIEGPPAAVEALLMRLLRDKRHTGLTVLADVPARMRLFGTWDLKWVRSETCRGVDALAKAAGVEIKPITLTAAPPRSASPLPTASEQGAVIQLVTDLVCAEETIY